MENRMKKTSSYQWRKRDIAYYCQCIKELEEIARELVKQIDKPKLLLRGGIEGDKFITPYNNGEFDMSLLWGG